MIYTLANITHVICSFLQITFLSVILKPDSKPNKQNEMIVIDLFWWTS